MKHPMETVEYWQGFISGALLFTFFGMGLMLWICYHRVSTAYIKMLEEQDDE